MPPSIPVVLLAILPLRPFAEGPGRPPGPPDPAAESEEQAARDRRLADLRFALIVEDWAIDSIEPGDPRRSLDAQFPPRSAVLARMLGNPCWEARDFAEGEIAAMGDGAFRLLAWAERHNDKHIAERSRLLMNAIFFPCYVCDNLGYRDAKHEEWWKGNMIIWLYTDTCYACGGAGDSRRASR